MNSIERQPELRISKNATLYVKPSAEEFVDIVYPIGSLYITTSNADTCPIQKLIPGSEWEKIKEGLCLQQVKSSQTVGNNIEAGLPNIKGQIGAEMEAYSPTGCFYPINYTWQNAHANHSYWHYSDVGFDASRYNKIYGRSDTVQPAALLVNIWRRTA